MDGINSSRYAYLLNTAGRIQADLFIYTHELNDLFLDVDGTLLRPFVDQLLKYKMRRNLNITSCDGQLTPIAVYQPIDADLAAGRMANVRPTTVGEKLNLEIFVF